MSDPVTNMEIEDVLSSIRRLIADGDRPEPAPKPDSSGPDSSDGPLVLTPSLRVAEEAGEQEASAANDPLATARMVARLEAAITAEDDDFEPDGSEVTAGVAEEDALPVFRSHDRSRLSTDPMATDHMAGALARKQLSEDEGDHAVDGEMDGDIFRDLDQLPDEQILRDLIAEVLRDELAGGLGERITRNVRKLVRREIYRILESRGLE